MQLLAGWRVFIITRSLKQKEMKYMSNIFERVSVNILERQKHHSKQDEQALLLL
jgi:hypothetical protein